MSESETVHTDTIESLAGKLAAFAEGLPDDERRVLDRFFLANAPEVQGFGGFDQLNPLSFVDVSANYSASLSAMMQRLSQTSGDITANMK